MGFSSAHVHVVLGLCLALLWAAPVRSEQEPVPLQDSSEVSADTTPSPAYRFAAVRAGYRFVTPADSAAAAAPYSLLTPGVMGGIAAGSYESESKVSASATVLNEDDYHTELLLDHQGRYRLHLESEALRHNLLPEILPPGVTGVYSSRNLSPGASYGIRSAVSQANGRVRLGELPVHLELGYWQMNREGNEPLRFSDHSFYDPVGTILSMARPVDSTTREGKLGVDAVVGVLGFSYGFLVRDYRNEAPASRYQYAASAGGVLLPGLQAHDTIPDSRVISHTFKIFSDQSGGLTGAAAYNLTTRENRGGSGDVRPTGTPSASLHSVAGDISYTPLREVTLALKYRHQEIERQSPAMVWSPYVQFSAGGPLPAVFTGTPGVLLVRPASSVTRDSLNASATYRPSPRASLRLEYRAELESRDQLPDATAPDNPRATGSDNRQTHTGTAAFSWHPHNGIRLTSSYSYASCDNPATAASFGERHDGRISLAYAARSAWGATASYQLRQERGESPAGPLSPFSSYRLPRDSHSRSATASFWFSPLTRMTVTGSYSYLLSETDQTLLFSSSVSPATGDPLVATGYVASAHVYGVDAVYAFTEQLDLSLAFQQVFSYSRFSVPERGYPLVSDPTTTTSGLGSLSRMETTETGITTRADWHVSRHVDLTLDYVFRLLASGGEIPSGSLHATMVSLMARW